MSRPRRTTYVPEVAAIAASLRPTGSSWQLPAHAFDIWHRRLSEVRSVRKSLLAEQLVAMADALEHQFGAGAQAAAAVLTRLAGALMRDRLRHGDSFD